MQHNLQSRILYNKIPSTNGEAMPEINQHLKLKSNFMTVLQVPTTPGQFSVETSKIPDAKLLPNSLRCKSLLTSDTSEGTGKSQAPIISTKYQKLQIG